MHQPKHPKTLHFLTTPLFEDLQSFQELESRIQQLTTNREKGDAFEVFAQAYLATQRDEVDSIWAFDDIPLKIKQKLHLTDEWGIDGAYQDFQQSTYAYQVKFRSDRKALTWSKDLSNFMGYADYADHKVLFTNSDTLPKIMRDRKDFFCIRGNDLDRLEAQDFENILQWMRGEKFEPQLFIPRPYQQEAISKIVDGLNSEDRVTSVMPCGTGKTLVAFWVAQQLDAKNILVLVPSLALLRQTLHVWRTQTRKMPKLAVCSDPTVRRGNDNLVIEQCDLDFPVSTDSGIVSQFLSQETPTSKIVFSTYQSSQVIAAGMSETDRFDFAVFDEAHKTAGRQDTKFSFALDDDKLSIKKRLFMTATPRHYNINKTNKDGDHQLVYSMDDEEKYGQRIHELSFAKAIEREIICDYKVAISVVTSQEVNDELLSQGEVLVSTDYVVARQVANQIALKRAVEKYQTGKIITFHGKVNSAKSFVSKGNDGVGYHLTDFICQHVNGSMNTSERESIIKEFKNAEKSTISNARCLTEGVDVPTVDMVCFMSPKKSKVDIVQAVGRAMRTSDNKEFGYILIPLYLERDMGESIEDALARTDFSDVWDVINALKEQDEVLNDVISQMRTDKGRRKGFDDSRFREKVEILGADIDLGVLRRSITVELVDKLGLPWDERYGQLIEYTRKFGHCNVPRSYSNNPKLSAWVHGQRQYKRVGKLSKDQVKKLNQLGFLWDPHESQWNQTYQQLILYKQQFGHCNVPTEYDVNPVLGRWVRKQRQKYKSNQINSERIKKLEELGLVWDPDVDNWNQMYQKLILYKQQFGHCNVRQKYRDNRKLGGWVTAQRSLRKKSKLERYKIEKLDQLDFSWNPKEDYWNQMYQQLVFYKQQFGDCNVPDKWVENKKLSTWVGTNRAKYKSKTLDNDKMEKLNQLGFIWGHYEYRWNENLELLISYKKKFGDCNVPIRYPDCPRLGQWVNSVREYKKFNKLSEGQIKQLESIGFIWNLLDYRWNQMYQKLVAYHQEFGNCNVTRRYIANPELAIWVSKQRETFRKGKLNRPRIEKLNQLGFWWDPEEDFWKSMYKSLVSYKEKHGNCNVPQFYSEDQQLGTWVNTQRQYKKKGKLQSDKINKLNSLGFSWDPKEDYWNQMYQQLVVYKQEIGNCNVPRSYDSKLNTWISSNNRSYKNGKLDPDKIEKLNQLGFEWTRKKPTKSIETDQESHQQSLFDTK